MTDSLVDSPLLVPAPPPQECIAEDGRLIEHSSNGDVSGVIVWHREQPRIRDQPPVLLGVKQGWWVYMLHRASTGMSNTPVIASLYPVMLALGNISVGVGLYVTGALVFAVLMWTTGALVLIGLVSAVAPGLFPPLEGKRDVSHRHPR